MIQRFFTNLVAKLKSQNSTMQCFIILIIFLIIGVILRWKFIIDEAGRGFEFFNK